MEETISGIIAAVPIVRSRAELENVVVHANSNNDNNNSNMNPAAKIATVSAQTYQNYKSALKWWHKYDNPEWGKVGYPWPGDVDDAINIQIASYKRDVGLKKRAGYMKQKEGKSPYNLIGYVEHSKFFMKMRPINNKYTWMEGIFASLCVYKNDEDEDKNEEFVPGISPQQAWHHNDVFERRGQGQKEKSNFDYLDS